MHNCVKLCVNIHILCTNSIKLILLGDSSVSDKGLFLKIIHVLLYLSHKENKSTLHYNTIRNKKIHLLKFHLQIIYFIYLISVKQWIGT